MTAEIIDGRRIAEEIRREVKEEVKRLRDQMGITPRLGVVLVGCDGVSEVYVSAKEKAARESGIETKTVRLPDDCNQEELLRQLKDLNASPDYHGVLVQLPLPPHIDTMAVVDAISPEKDVDGLHPTNMGLLLMGTPRFVPCTQAGIQAMLVAAGFWPGGQHVVICGRSRIVGRPLAALMLQKDPEADATVTVCHTGTRDLASITHQADILVAAIDKPRGITADMVKDGAVIIDVGVHRVEDTSAKKGYRLVGDVDFDGVVEKAKAISPVPGGVGPMTVSMLLVNTLKAARLAVESDVDKVPVLAG